MRRLMNAGLNRLFRSRLFWLEMIFCAGFSLWILLINYSPAIQASGDRVYMDSVFFTLHQIMGVVLAVSISLAVGTEYSDGTMRNKLIVGRTRGEVYFSQLLTHMIATVLALLAHGAVNFTLGLQLFGSFEMPAVQLATVLGCVVLNMMVYAALFSAIALNCSNRAFSAVASLLLAIALIFIASFCYAKLCEPEMTYDGVTITVDGLQYGDLIANPAYVRGGMRQVYQFICDLLPSGQLMQIQDGAFDGCARWPAFSAVLGTLITAAGFYLFRRRDIR